jgi:hypothetical protein
MKMASVRGPSLQGLPQDVRQDIDRHNFLDFAGVLLMLVGGFNLVEGISAISGSKYVNDHLLFANLDTWGWFFVIAGVIQIAAGWFVMKGAGWAAIVGIVSAFCNAVAHLAASDTFVFWTMTVLAIDILIIYGLVRYGGSRGRGA